MSMPVLRGTVQGLTRSWSGPAHDHPGCVSLRAAPAAQLQGVRPHSENRIF
jgi:hypothetical protein